MQGHAARFKSTISCTSPGHARALAALGGRKRPRHDPHAVHGLGACAELGKAEQLLDAALAGGEELQRGVPAELLLPRRAPCFLMPLYKVHNTLRQAAIASGAEESQLPLRLSSHGAHSVRECTGRYNVLRASDGVVFQDKDVIPPPVAKASNTAAAAAALRGLPCGVERKAQRKASKGRLRPTRRVIMWDLSCGRERLPIPVVVDSEQDIPHHSLQRLLLAALHYTPAYLGKDHLQEELTKTPVDQDAAAGDDTRGVPVLDNTHWHTLAAAADLQREATRAEAHDVEDAETVDEGAATPPWSPPQALVARGSGLALAQLEDGPVLEDWSRLGSSKVQWGTPRRTSAARAPRFPQTRPLDFTSSFKFVDSAVQERVKQRKNKHVYSLSENCVIDAAPHLAGVVPVRKETCTPALKAFSLSVEGMLARLPTRALPLAQLRARSFFVEDWPAGAEGPCTEEAARQEMVDMLARYQPLLHWSGIVDGDGRAQLPRFDARGCLQWHTVNPALVKAGGHWGSSFGRSLPMYGGSIVGRETAQWGSKSPATSHSGAFDMHSCPGRGTSPPWIPLQDAATGFALSTLPPPTRVVTGSGHAAWRVALPQTQVGVQPSGEGESPSHFFLPLASEGVDVLASPVVEAVGQVPHGDCDHCHDVVQRGLRWPLEVFWSGFAAKGFGVRSRCDIPKGAFVSLYAGVVTTQPVACGSYVLSMDALRLYLERDPDERPAYKREAQRMWKSAAQLRERPDALHRGIAGASGHNPCGEGVQDPEPAFGLGVGALPEGDPSAPGSEWLTHTPGAETLCVDASVYSNVGRFFNHSCHPNMVPVPVMYGLHHDVRVPALALFASKDIPAGEELTWYYVEKFGTKGEGAKHSHPNGKSVTYCLCDWEHLCENFPPKRFWARPPHMMHWTPGEVLQASAQSRARNASSAHPQAAAGKTQRNRMRRQRKKQRRRERASRARIARLHAQQQQALEATKRAELEAQRRERHQKRTAEASASASEHLAPPVTLQSETLASMTAGMGFTAPNSTVDPHSRHTRQPEIYLPGHASLETDRARLVRSEVGVQGRSVGVGSDDDVILISSSDSPPDIDSDTGSVL